MPPRSATGYRARATGAPSCSASASGRCAAGWWARRSAPTRTTRRRADGGPRAASPAVGHHLAGEPRHGLPHRGAVHDATLVEVADELVHLVVAAQGAHALDAVVGVAEHAHLAVDVVEPHALHPGQHLLERL